MARMKVVEMHGSFADRGYQHGQQLKAEIHEFYEKWIRVSQECANPPQERDLLNYAKLHLPFSQEYAPELIEEMEGIAQGAGISFEKIFFLNCYDEVSSYSPEVVAKGLKGGCTAFAAVGDATVSGGTLLGQGWDMDGWYIPYVFHIKSWGDEPEIIGLTHPGLLCGCGLNSCGISFVWNSLKPTDTRIGVPVTLIGRKVLHQATLSGAVGKIINAYRANGFNMLLGSPEGAADVETTAEKYFVTYVQDLFAHANHYEAPSLLEYEEYLPNIVPDTLIRSGRMRQLLNRHKGAIDTELCQRIMCDHVNFPASICRHHSPEIPWQTQSSVIISPQEGLFLASNGRPCEAGFDAYFLEKKPFTTE